MTALSSSLIGKLEELSFTPSVDDLAGSSDYRVIYLEDALIAARQYTEPPHLYDSNIARDPESTGEASGRAGVGRSLKHTTAPDVVEAALSAWDRVWDNSDCRTDEDTENVRRIAMQAAIAAMGDASTRKDEGLDASHTSPVISSEISLEIPKPLPCPFCGGAPWVEEVNIGDSPTWEVRCYGVHSEHWSCRARPAVMGKGSKLNAIKEWNMRYPEPVSIEVILHEAMKRFRFVVTKGEPVFLSNNGEKFITFVLDAAGVKYVD